ncbi:MAG: hypothetical protein ABIM74_03950 [candidate division WOR-3 bacterium]
MWEGDLDYGINTEYEWVYWTTVYVVNRDDIWIAGYYEGETDGGCGSCISYYYYPYPCVAHWDGQNWTAELLTDFRNVSAIKIFFVNENLGWLLLSDGTLMRYQGGSWATDTIFPYDEHVTALAFLSQDNGYAAGKWVYHYNGSSWSKVTEIPHYYKFFRNIDFSSPEDIWVVGDAGSVRWNGSEWIMLDSIRDCESVAVVDTDDVWIGLCYAYSILHWDGVAWDTFGIPVQSVDDIEVQSPGSIWCVGDGDLYYFDPGDSAWHKWNFGEAIYLYDLHFFDSTYGGAAGDPCILKYEKE